MGGQLKLSKFLMPSTSGKKKRGDECDDDKKKKKKKKIRKKAKLGKRKDSSNIHGRLEGNGRSMMAN